MFLWSLESRQIKKIQYFLTSSLVFFRFKMSFSWLHVKSAEAVTVTYSKADDRTHTMYEQIASHIIYGVKLWTDYQLKYYLSNKYKMNIAQYYNKPSSIQISEHVCLRPYCSRIMGYVFVRDNMAAVTWEVLPLCCPVWFHGLKAENRSIALLNDLFEF